MIKPNFFNFTTHGEDRIPETENINSGRWRNPSGPFTIIVHSLVKWPLPLLFLVLAFDTAADAASGTVHMVRPKEITQIIKPEDVSNKFGHIQGEKRAALESASGKLMVSENPEQDIFQITSDVRLKNPERIGMCMKGTITFITPWGGSGMQNSWSTACTFEPIIFRWNWMIDDKQSVSTEEYLEHRGKAGPSYWALFPDDFWNGADFRLYRNVDGTMKEIHHTKVKKFDMSEELGKVPYNYVESGGRIWYEDKGPVAQFGDEYVMTMVCTKIPDHPKFYPGKDGKPGRAVNSFNTFGQLVPEPGTEWEIDDTQKAPEGGSTASLKMTLAAEPANRLKGCSQPYFAILDKWVGDWNREKQYKCSIWMRQKDLQSPVTVQVGTFITKEFEVGSEWKKYEFDVPTSELQPYDREKLKFLVGSTSAGTLWIDNMIIYQTDVEPFAILPKFRRELEDFKPSTLRWQNGGMDFHRTVDAWLNDKFREQPAWVKTVYGTFGIGLPSFLTLCKEMKAKAWLNTNLPNEEECLKLMEYLCGPADSPYGKRRQEVGQTRPWVEELDQIIIEVANEPWNGMFAPLAWGGRTDAYVAWCNMIFANMKKSPYYEKYKDKILFCAAGWGVSPGEIMGDRVIGWTGDIFSKCKEANMTNWGYYIGGWDGITLSADNERDLFQYQLLYPQFVDNKYLEKGLAAREFIKRVPGKSDNPMYIGIYEFGPGYALPNPGTPYIVEAEYIGKSLAMGVATLDEAMNFLEKGCDAPLCYFRFGGGVNFSTHNDINLTRPIPAFLALKMRNLYCNGDLMQVNTEQVKKVSVPEMMAYKRMPNNKYMEKIVDARDNIEMTKCYAFRQGKEHSILLLNRNVDEARKVVLKLPFKPKSGIIIHKLTGSEPGANNINEMQVEIQEEKRSDFAQEYTLELPACSVYCISATE